MSIAASEGESDFSGDDVLAQLPPLGTVAVPDMDPEMMAMLTQAANQLARLSASTSFQSESSLVTWPE